MRWCWVNFQCLLIWIKVGQGPTALAVGTGGGCLDIFSLVCPFPVFLSLGYHGLTGGFLLLRIFSVAISGVFMFVLS